MGDERVALGPTAAQPDFGAQLRRLRFAARLTQETLAERTGLSVRGLSDLERGARRLPQRETLQRLITALALSPAESAKLVNSSGRTDIPLPAERLLPSVPSPISSFVGRQSDIAELTRLLQSARLLTLTGPGGVGKTRLALEVASRAAARFADGIMFVELAALSDERLIPQIVAAGLGIEPHMRSDVFAEMCNSLQSRQLLLLLDNCEHMLEGCRALAERLLWACPHLQILATSRTRFGVAGETCWAVAPLGVPSLNEPDSLEAVLERSDAAQLFLQRARQANRSLEVGETGCRAILEICRRLDGLPLALELAAAWANVLPLVLIAERLGSSDLSSESSSSVRRHRTLVATLDWSLALLGQADCEVFDQICVFHGGFDLAAAEAVAGPDVLPALARLADASLVVSDSGQIERPRYRVLEPLREAGVKRLDASGGAERVRDRHAAYFLQLTESVQDGIWGRTGYGNGIPLLERDAANLRAALRWLIDCAEIERAGRLGVGLARFWQFSGRAAEGRAWLGELLALPAMSEPVRVRLGIAYGAAATQEGDLVLARPVLEDGLAAARRLGDDWAIAWALIVRIMVARDLSDPSAIVQILADSDEGVERSRAAGDVILEIRHTYLRGGILALVGQLAEAEETARRAQRMARAARTLREVAWATWVLAICRYKRGDLAGARALFMECRRDWHAEREPSVELLGLIGQVLVNTDGGQDRRACAALLELLELWRMTGRAPDSAERVLEPFAYVAAGRGDFEDVVRVCGILNRHMKPFGILTRFGRDIREQLSQARAVLGEPAASMAWAEGQALSLDDAIELVRRRCTNARRGRRQTPRRISVVGGAALR